jgi:hypothetical protein
MLIFLLSFLISADPQVLIAALAKVGDQVITSRDLQINLFLNEIQNPLIEFQDSKEPLKDLVSEHLMVKEASSLLVVKLDESEVVRTEEKVMQKLKNDRLWQSLAVAPKELREQVQRKLLVRNILNLKMPKDLLSVNDEAIESYYMQNKNQLGQKPISEVRDKITQILKLQKNQERFRDWMAAVFRTHSVVYYSGYKIK